MIPVAGIRNSTLYRLKHNNDFIYNKSYQGTGTTTFRCRQRYCPAAVKVNNFHVENEDGSFGHIFSGGGEDVHLLHDHIGRDGIAKELDFKAACRKRARLEPLGLKEIYDDQCRM